MSKKLYIKTYGCQMNVYDSERMFDVLAPHGFTLTEAANDADLIILNTCHIREKAADKVFSDLGRFKQVKRNNGAVIAVAGCVAQAEGEAILRRAPYVDLVFGPQVYHLLPEMIARAEKGRVVNIDFPPEPKFDFLPESSGKGYSAFLAIQEGCDRFCTYCVVPYTRGAEYSRPPQQILQEAQRIAANGVKEITLLGQNVNSYNGDDWTLARLIREIANIPGLERIRYTTSYPADVDDELIAAHAEIPQLMPFLHLPIQSGSDNILQAMNRRHKAEDYLYTVSKLQKARPDLKLSSDFIVGFPGETEEDFQKTLGIIEEVKFIQAYSFKYSPRPGTPAAGFSDQIPDALKVERLARLQEKLEQVQLEFNHSLTGTILPVLLDRKGKHEGQLLGRTPYMQPVHVELPETKLGEIVDLRIISAHENSLGGVATQKEMH